MKVTKLSTVETEVEVNLSWVDIAACFLTEDDANTTSRVLSGINDLGGFLKSIPPEVIDGMHFAHRTTISAFLQEQASRFALPDPPADEAAS